MVSQFVWFSGIVIVTIKNILMSFAIAQTLWRHLTQSEMCEGC